MRRRTSPALFLALLGLTLAGIAGCGNPFTFDPATTVILKVTGAADDADQQRIEEKATELVIENSTWHKIQTSKHAETLMIKLSPVVDAQEFADRIEFGEVTEVDGNVIHLKANEE